MEAGLYHLKHLGITRLTHPTSVSSAMSQLPDEAIVLAVASHVERELLITPWNLSSSNFVARTNQFRAPMSSTIMKKKTAAAHGGSTTVIGTDANPQIGHGAAREVLLKFNVPDDVTAKQTRCHCIAMIHKLSSDQAASGIKVDPTTISNSKYACERRMSFLQLQQQTREKCQEIWDHQVQSLSAVDGEENESDSGANGDLDSFAGDLEILLDAEECGDEEEGNNESKYDRADGVEGLKLRRCPLKDQAEEEIEDGADEGAELCCLLMNDVEAEQKKKKNNPMTWDMVFAFGSQSSAGAETVKQIKKANPRPKQVISVVQPSRSATKENTILDLAIVESTIFGKVKGIKLKGTSSSCQQTKIKILGDNPKASEPIFVCITFPSLDVFKEKKSSREHFVCGACGQLGHMRTNKNCPKYGEDSESHAEATEQKASRYPIYWIHLVSPI
ncbi:hypothetical protein SLEP1_g38145 [Rubroshorea leprosula]|uniref:Zinc knuckle domain-containing protein n=1 Tax=Rubroshorea leprosula TaxID=152421 RepID=A0AAV5KWY4_9ROSI|nr:hypothetical protein SLEP1_g38145 [Rubroshorea leprosula]